MKNEQRQLQMFSNELPTWESLPAQLQETVQQLLSLLLEHEVTESHAGHKEKSHHV